MYGFRKSKKGFTLIELMVVVAIIGVLALLGLRVYTGQQEKAKNAIVKANAATVHTLIQGELADTNPSTVASMFTLIEATATTNGEQHFKVANMKNPYDASDSVVNGGSGTIGEVSVSVDTDDIPYVWTIQGYGESTTSKAGDALTARR